MSLIFGALNYYRANPIRTIILVALFLRILAAFFSKGYAFHDDHFCVTRVAQAWVDGIPHWLQAVQPPKHSMFYAAINAGFLYLAEFIGIEDTIAKATFMRLFHAFYSVLIVWLVYKLVLVISQKKHALWAAWIVAILWFMPFLSVKFLVEMVCIPPVLGGFYMIVRQKNYQLRIAHWLAAGLLFGIAFAIRYHTILLAGGLGLVMLYRQQWKGSFLFSLAYIAAALALVGIPDIIYFDYPFHSVAHYFFYNSDNATQFIQGSPLKFTGTLLGFLVPPVSLLLSFGFLRSYKFNPEIYVAVLVFFIFHSLFPNQQERFILPIYPLVIALGTIGWLDYVEHSTFWQQRHKLHQGIWKFFWIINVLVAFALIFTFSKRDRVEPLHYLSKVKDFNGLLIENERGVKMPPVYYLGSSAVDNSQFGITYFGEEALAVNTAFKFVYRLTPGRSISELHDLIRARGGVRPNYVIMQGRENLERRKGRIYEALGDGNLKLIETVEPGNLDKLLHYFNPRIHRDQTAFIFKFEAAAN